jgi:hypothetical protein
VERKSLTTEDSLYTSGVEALLAADEPSDENHGQNREEEHVEHDQTGNERKQESDEKKQQTDKLELKDWIALISAALQTLFIPVLVVLVMLFFLAVIIRVLL